MGPKTIASLGVVLAIWVGCVRAAQEIYTCTDANGRRLTADRPIAECLDREQRMLRPDGSLRGVVRPALTQGELNEMKARERQEADDRFARQEASRRDRLLLQRYPDQTTHDVSRQAALVAALQLVRSSELRFSELAEVRKQLLMQTAQARGAASLELKQKIGANEATIQAQRDLLVVQRAEVDRLNASYDSERAMLKKIWESNATITMTAPAAGRSKQPLQNPSR